MNLQAHDSFGLISNVIFIHALKNDLIQARGAHQLLQHSWKAEARELQLWAQSGQLRNLMRPCFEIKHIKKTGLWLRVKALGSFTIKHTHMGARIHTEISYFRRNIQS